MQTLQRVVTQMPVDPVAHAMLGGLAFGRKDCPAAVREFSLTDASLAQRKEVAFPLGSCLLQMNRPLEAATALEPALQAQPDDPALRYDVALTQWRGGDVEAAQKTLAPLLAAPRPAASTLTLGAQLAEKQNNTQAALDLLRRAVQDNPRDRDAYLDFARLAYDHASVQVGIDLLDLGLQNLPNDAELYFARGVLEAQKGQMDQTMDDLQHAAALNPKLAYVGTAEGIAASQAHQFGTAEQRLRQQTRLHPGDAAAWYLLAEALASEQLDAGSPKAAEMVHAAEEAVRLDPNSAEAHGQLASIYLREGDAAKAMTQCNEALKAHPDDPQLLYQLLLATRKAGQKDQLPALVERLKLARQASEEAEGRDRKQALVEVPATASSTNGKP